MEKYLFLNIKTLSCFYSISYFKCWSWLVKLTSWPTHWPQKNSLKKLIVKWKCRIVLGFPSGTSGKEPTWQCKRCERHGHHPRVGRSPGEGHGNTLQYSWLDNPMDRGAWRAIVHRVIKTWPKWLSMQHTCVIVFLFFFPIKGRMFISSVSEWNKYHHLFKKINNQHKKKTTTVITVNI